MVISLVGCGTLPASLKVTLNCPEHSASGQSSTVRGLALRFVYRRCLKRELKTSVSALVHTPFDIIFDHDKEISCKWEKSQCLLSGVAKDSREALTHFQGGQRQAPHPCLSLAILCDGVDTLSLSPRRPRFSSSSAPADPLFRPNMAVITNAFDSYCKMSREGEGDLSSSQSGRPCFCLSHGRTRT